MGKVSSVFDFRHGSLFGGKAANLGGPEMGTNHCCHLGTGHHGRILDVGQERRMMFIKNNITTEAVMALAEDIEIGATVKAEVYSLRSSNSGISDNTTIEDVTILEKYPYFAMTDRGAITWTNIAIHNRSQLRKELIR